MKRVWLQWLYEMILKELYQGKVYLHYILFYTPIDNCRCVYRATNDEDPAVPLAPNNIKVVSSHERPHWFTQFRILADRTFKNLYRNPLLMFSHYTIAVVIACK
jgi:hypothetical protein